MPTLNPHHAPETAGVTPATFVLRHARAVSPRLGIAPGSAGVPARNRGFVGWAGTDSTIAGGDVRAPRCVAPRDERGSARRRQVPQRLAEVGGLVDRPLELLIETADVRHDALGLVPLGEAAELDAADDILHR